MAVRGPGTGSMEITQWEDQHQVIYQQTGGLGPLPSIRVFSNESTLCMRWPKYWSFSISPSIEYSGLISLKIDWFDPLAVQGTLKSLLQHHSSKASILQRSAFFMVQLSHPYVTTGKTITLTRRTFVGKVMSLLFNMLSRLVKVSICAWINLWAFYFVPLIYISVFVPVPYCLDNCGFVVEPEVR